MGKVNTLVILTLMLALTSTVGLAAESRGAVVQARTNEISDLLTRASKDIRDCSGETILNSARESGERVSSVTGRTGCLLSDAPKPEAEPGELFQTDPQPRETGISGY